MTDSFNCLRHNAVIGSNHQNNDVSNLGTTGTHFRKGLMPRRINKSYLVSGRHRNLIRTDMLGNAARLFGRNVGFAQSIQQGCLTMVNVSHNRNHRRTRQQIIRFVFGSQSLFDIALGNALELVPEILNNQLSRIGVNRLINRCHNPETHQFLITSALFSAIRLANS